MRTNSNLKRNILAMSLFGCFNMAQAGTMGPVDNLSWTGFYVGVNQGGIWGDANFSYVPATAFAATTIAAFNTYGPATLDDASLLGGIQVGANYQLGSFVAGVEADFSLTSLNDNRVLKAQTFSPNTISVEQQFSVDWVSTVRGRLGYGQDAWLIYGTGGLAIANPEYRDSAIFESNGVITNTYLQSSQNTNLGWTAGAGLEWKFTPNLSVKAEYLYLELEKANHTAYRLTQTGATDSTFFVEQSHQFTANIGRIGLNYTC